MLTGFIKAQQSDIFGTWLSTCEIRTQIEFPSSLLPADSFEVEEIDIFDIKKESRRQERKRIKEELEQHEKDYQNALKKYPDSIQVADYFYDYNSILEILPSNRLRYVEYDNFTDKSGKTLQMKWKKLNDSTLEVLSKPYKSTIIQFENKRIIWEQYSDSLENSRIIFEKQKSSVTVESIGDYEKKLKNNTYQIILTNSSLENPTEFFFLDENTGFATYYFEDNYYTERLWEWKIYEYLGHNFLKVQGNFMPYYYHLINLTDSTIISDGYRFNSLFDREYPFYEKFTFAEVNLSNNNSPLDSNDLIGHWSNISEPFPFDSTLSIYKSIDSTYLEIEIMKNGKFMIKYGGVVTSDYSSWTEKKSFSGNWNLYNKNNILVLKPQDSENNRDWICFVKTLSDDILELNLEMGSLKGHLNEHMSIKFTKMND